MNKIKEKRKYGNNDEIKVPQFDAFFTSFPVVTEENLNFMLTNLDNYYRRIFYFIIECVKFCERIMNSIRHISWEIKGKVDDMENEECLNEEYYEVNDNHLFMKNFISTSIKQKRIDSIDSNLCILLLSSMNNVEFFMLTKEKVIKEFFSSSSVQAQSRLKNASIKTEKSFDYFEIVWIILLNHRFFFFWYFIIYRNVLEKLDALLDELLKMEKYYDSSSFLDEENGNNQYNIFKTLLKTKLKEIGKIEGEKNGKDHWFDSKIIDALKTLLSINNDKKKISKFIQEDHCIFYMNLREVLRLIKRISPSITSDSFFTKDLECIVNALTFKFSFLVLFDCEPDDEDAHIFDDLEFFQFEGQQSKKTLTNMRIKQFSNFFIKCQRTFNNFKAIKMANKNACRLALSSFDVVLEKEKNRYFLKETVFMEKKLYLEELKQYFKNETLQQTHILFCIMNNLYRIISFEGGQNLQINLSRKISTNTLKKIYGKDEEIEAFFMSEIIQKNNGVLSTIRNSFKLDSKLEFSNKQTKSSIYKDEREKAEKREKEHLKTIIENLEVESFPLKTNTFLDIIKDARSDREMIFFENCLFKLFPQQIIFNTPPHHQMRFLKQNALLEFIASSIDNICLSSTRFLEKFFIDLTSTKKMGQKIYEMSKIDAPIIVKRMARYDILFYDIQLYQANNKQKETKKFLITKKKKKIYKCGDVFECFAFWIYLSLKFMQVEKNNQQIPYNSNKLQSSINLKLLAEQFISKDKLNLVF